MKVGKTVRSNNRILMIYSVHPASKDTDVKSIQRPLLESEGTSNCRVVSEFTLPNSTTVLTKLRPEPETSTPKRSHVLKVACVLCSWDRALEPASEFHKSV